MNRRIIWFLLILIIMIFTFNLLDGSQYEVLSTESYNRIRVRDLANGNIKYIDSVGPVYIGDIIETESMKRKYIMLTLFCIGFFPLAKYLIDKSKI